MKNYEAAIQQYIDQIKDQEEVIGILITGSYIRGQPDKHSDVDIIVVLHPDCEFRERGNTWIDGVEIEYFQNPPQQIRSYFIKEKNSPHTAHMLVNSDLRYKAHPVIDELIEEARVILETPPAPMTDFQLKFERYGLDDLEKDFKDTIDKNDPVAKELMRFKIINKCIDVLMKVNQERRFKIKGLGQQIEAIDPPFFQLFQNAILNKEKDESLFNLIRYTEQLIGGKRSTEWVLRSKLDLV